MKEDNPRYIALMNFLKNEIESAENTENANEVGKLKKRLNALNANMVDYLVGGVTVAERDMYKDLVEDAVKNCKSAALYGVGHAANFEGLINSYKVAEKGANIAEFIKYPGLIQSIANAIFESYVEISAVLYGTVEYDKEKVAEYIAKSIELGAPYNISNGYLPEIDDISTDVDYDGHIFKTMRMEQAEKAVEFIENMVNQGRTTFYIHCRAGMSRSRAFGEFIYRTFGEDFDIEYEDRNNYTTILNQGVLRRLNHAYWKKHKMNCYANGEDYDEELVHPEIRKIDLYGEE
jgi:hypothetical protein